MLAGGKDRTFEILDRVTRKKVGPWSSSYLQWTLLCARLWRGVCRGGRARIWVNVMGRMPQVRWS